MIFSKSEKLKYKISRYLNISINEINQLSDEQIDYINHNLGISSYLEACPGSGKTEVIGLKTAYEISKWSKPYSGIAILTFTNSAEKVLQNRILKYSSSASVNFPHFVGTFDSWLHNYIFQPFAHKLINYNGKDGDKSIRIIDINSHADFLYSFKTKSKYRSYKSGTNILQPQDIFANQIYFDLKENQFYCQLYGFNQAQSITEIYYLQAFQDFVKENTWLTIKKFKDDIKDTKLKFWKSGFVNFQDVEVLSNKLLKKENVLTKKIALRFPVIIIDECQDLSFNQLSILNKLIETGVSVHLIGDLNQAIYEFRKVDINDTLTLIKKNNFLKYKLTNNFRSSQNIVDCCQKLINAENINGIKNDEKSALNLITYDNIQELVPKFIKIIKSKNLNIQNSIIIARGKSTIIELSPQDESKYNNNKTILFAQAIKIWNNANRNTIEIQKTISLFGKSISKIAYRGEGSYYNQYCPDYISSFEWRLFLKEMIIQTKQLYPFATNGKPVTWTEWAKILKQFLGDYWQYLPGNTTNWEEVKTSLKAPPKKKYGDTLEETLGLPNSQLIINIKTIHGVKGETYDAVMFVSHKNKQSPGGHYSHWLSNDNENEHKRFAYVASSRPKHILIWAIPNNRDIDNSEFEKLGFVRI